jgi:hypothetical protein
MRNLISRKTCAVFLALVVFAATLSYVYSLSTSSDIIPSIIGPIVPYGVNATSGSPTDIENAINIVIAHGGGIVYIPAGDWRCDQQPVGAYGYGGAIPIDLENLPSGAWLSIIGSYDNVTTTTQNGVSITCPATILRSYTVNDNNLTATVATFGIVGSNISSEYPADFNGVLGANRHIRISGITILGDVESEGSVTSNGNTGISLSFVDGFLIDHCWIDSNTGSDIGSSYSKGVVTNCTITQLYHTSEGGQWGYGVQVSGNFNFYHNGLGTPTWIDNTSQIWGLYNWQGISINWDLPTANSTLGSDGNGPFISLVPQTPTTSISYTAGPVYIESSTFYECRHCVTSSEYGYYVFRYNFLYGGVGLQSIDQHGGGPSEVAQGYATRGSEVYDNYVNGNPLGLSLGVSVKLGTSTYGDMSRAGAGLFFNNTIVNSTDGIELGNENYNSNVSAYPEYINNYWIWGNTYSGVSSPLVIISGVGITASTNYFCDSCGGTRTPTTPAPPPTGYTPYTYPSPLAPP